MNSETLISVWKIFGYCVKWRAMINVAGPTTSKMCYNEDNDKVFLGLLVMPAHNDDDNDD